MTAQSSTPTDTSPVKQAVGKGLKVLGLNKDRKDEEDGEATSAEVEDNGTTPYTITDVREFKSMLQVSAGPQPVKHISEFEDLDAKL
jgi:insulysin